MKLDERRIEVCCLNEKVRDEILIFTSARRWLIFILFGFIGCLFINGAFLICGSFIIFRFFDFFKFPTTTSFMFLCNEWSSNDLNRIFETKLPYPTIDLYSTVLDSSIVWHNHRKVSIDGIVLYIATSDHEDDRIRHERNDKPRSNQQHGIVHCGKIFSYGNIRSCGIINSHHMFQKFWPMTIAILLIESTEGETGRYLTYSIIMRDK